MKIAEASQILHDLIIDVIGRYFEKLCIQLDHSIERLKKVFWLEYSHHDLRTGTTLCFSQS